MIAPFLRKLNMNLLLSGIILLLASQHKADAYLTALSGTLPHPGRFLTKCYFSVTADSLFSPNLRLHI
ncbi:hypothetical protein DMH17_11760 [Raoultella planticola]|nr:hypothetical protein [Raoultella planticola]